VLAAWHWEKTSGLHQDNGVHQDSITGVILCVIIIIIVIQDLADLLCTICKAGFNTIVEYYGFVIEEKRQKTAA
jgi:hypothetical protein